MLSVPTWALFMFVGTCLFAYYQINAGDLPSGIKSDEIFPYFIATEMPIGITGLIISALIAGAISSLDADVNCISAVVVEDYYTRFRPKATDKQKITCRTHICNCNRHRSYPNCIIICSLGEVKAF